MSTLEEIIFLLYSAQFNSQSLKASAWLKRDFTNIKYTVDKRNKQYTHINYKYDQRKIGIIEQEILWKRPYFFKLYEDSRSNGGKYFAHTVVNQENKSHCSDIVKFPYKEPVGLYDKEYIFGEIGEKHSHLETTYANYMASELLFINPMPLIYHTDLEILGSTNFLQRDVYHIQAYPKAKAFIQGANDPFFYQFPQYFDILVDAERGNLLKYTAIFEQKIIEDFEITEILFDIEIDDSEFADLM